MPNDPMMMDDCQLTSRKKNDTAKDTDNYKSIGRTCSDTNKTVVRNLVDRFNEVAPHGIMSSILHYCSTSSHYS